MSILHLRDWRHAHQFYTNFGHAFSPKAKFLYHVVFEFHEDVPLSFKQNSENFQKELAVLVNSTDLPAFRVNVENKQQYNRKKNMQTRIDYQDVQMRMWDDNVGSVRSMLQEYYQYYIEDGRHTTSDGSYLQRDKYHTGAPPNYGLNTRAHRTNAGFFKYIHIYQMGKNKWNRYTLVNPLLAQWQHGDVAYSEGAGLVEHSLTFAYEAVLYANGDVGSDSEPKNFTASETGYDTTPAFASTTPSTPMPGLASPTPSVFTSDGFSSGSNSTPSLISQLIFSNNAAQPTPGLPGTQIPQGTTAVSSTSPAGTTAPLLGSAAIRNGLSRSNEARTAFIAQAVNSGAIVIDTTGVNSYLDYRNLPANQRNAIMNDAIDRAASGDLKLAQFASNAIATTRR